MNGTFEPTEESQNGFPVYVKKGDKDTWVEMVYKPATGWRWVCLEISMTPFFRIIFDFSTSCLIVLSCADGT